MALTAGEDRAEPPAGEKGASEAEADESQTPWWQAGLGASLVVEPKTMIEEPLSDADFTLGRGGIWVYGVLGRAGKARCCSSSDATSLSDKLTAVY